MTEIFASPPSILVVDDEPNNTELLQDLLALDGYTIDTTNRPEQAISMAMAHEYDLFLLDINMPGMDGFELWLYLRDIYASPVRPMVIFVSGVEDAETKVRSFELGAVDYVCKPFIADELLARVRRHLEIQKSQHALVQQKQKLLKIIKQQKKKQKDFGEKYEILSIIGRGGMSHIYKARHKMLQCMMALKVLNIPDEYKEEFTPRFIQEARTLVKIKHPNVVSVYDAGPIKNLYYIAMEFVEGADLEKVLEKGPLPYSLVHRILEQAARGLAAAHALNIVHRDIKPANFLLDREHRLKVTDFGICKDLSQGYTTQAGMMIGTPAFMSPEQCQGQTVDARSDIYSLGVTLYYLLTGKVPFDDTNTIAAMFQNINNPLPDPRESDPNIPSYFCKILRKMTRKRPQDRYQTMEELIAALRRHEPTLQQND